MKTIALRFGETIAPECGTIQAHNEIITKYGKVWYGKFGNTISDKVINTIMETDNPKILLIHSGTTNRYWAYIEDISKSIPEKKYIPSYYHTEINRIKTWFCVNHFEKAENDVMSKCIVASSGAILSNASKHSMSPFFIIDYSE